MNRVPPVGGVWIVVVGIVLTVVALGFLVWAQSKGKARVFWMSRVGPGVMFGGVAIMVVGVVQLVRGR